MQKSFMKLLLVLTGITVVVSSFSFRKKHVGAKKSASKLPYELVTVPRVNEVDLNLQQSYGVFARSYFAFCEDLGFQESSSNYKAVNRLGYLGKYQFGYATLKWLGIRDKRKFLQSPDLQEKVFKALIAKNKYVLRDYIGKYGNYVNGVPVSESSLIAAAHLGGAGNVKKFLVSNGKTVFKDANNVPITKYMKQFAFYDLSGIPADRNAKAVL